MSNDIVIEPFLSEDPFTGLKTVSVVITGCPSIDILIHQEYRIPGLLAGDDCFLTIVPLAFLTKDGESGGGLNFRSKFIGGESPLIQVLFDDHSIIEKELIHLSGFEYNWPLTDEDCESFLFKKMKIIRVHNGDSFYDYNLEPPSDLDILYKGLSDLFPVLIEQFLMIAAKEAKWAPISPKPKGDDEPGVQDSSFEESADFCYVYLMNDTENGFYKIGMANDPEYRESTLQSEKPTIVKICQKKFPSRKIARVIESALHKVYENKRIRGEWFSLKERDIWEIKQTLS